MELPHPFLVHDEFLRSADSFNGEVHHLDVLVPLLLELLFHLDVHHLIGLNVYRLDRGIAQQRDAKHPGRFLQCAITITKAPSVSFDQPGKTASTVYDSHIGDQRKPEHRIITTERLAGVPSHRKHAEGDFAHASQGQKSYDDRNQPKDQPLWPRKGCARSLWRARRRS